MITKSRAAARGNLKLGRYSLSSGFGNAAAIKVTRGGWSKRILTKSIGGPGYETFLNPPPDKDRNQLMHLLGIKWKSISH